jgi:hypothetical protein
MARRTEVWHATTFVAGLHVLAPGDVVVTDNLGAHKIAGTASIGSMAWPE